MNIATGNIHLINLVAFDEESLFSNSSSNEFCAINLVLPIINFLLTISFCEGKTNTDDTLS